MIIWTPKAQQDVQEILRHVVEHFGAKKGTQTVKHLIDSVEKLLSQNPNAGKFLKRNPLILQLTLKGNVIFYTEHAKNKNIYFIYVRPRRTKLKISRFRFDVA